MLKSTKRIRRIAQEFSKEMGIDILPITLGKLEEIAKRKGWSILSYKSGEALIKRLDLERYTKRTKGFAYVSENYQIIFFKDELDYLDKIDTISHEIGHIVLNHISTETGSKCKHISSNANLIQEKEANLFSLELQASTYLMESMHIDTAKKLYDEGILSISNAIKQALHYQLNKTSYFVVKVIFLLIVLLIISNFYFLLHNKENYPQDNTIIKETDSHDIDTSFDTFNIYIKTRTGKAYHKSDCRYVKGKEDVIKVNSDEIKALDLNPCKVCKPE